MKKPTLEQIKSYLDSGEWSELLPTYQEECIKWLLDEFMEEIAKKLKQIRRILTGEEGPQLTLDRDEDARYMYPSKIKAALKVLTELDNLTAE